jgi:arylsulfatase B/arylsulfatase I/J
MPLEAPEEVFTHRAELLDTIPNKDRRTFAAMTILMDEAIGNLTSALKQAQMWDDTILIVMSDK